MLPAKSRSLGFSRLEMSFFALLIVFGGLLIVTKYLDLSTFVDGSMNEGVVTVVQQGITEYAEASKDRTGISRYPATLDDAQIGDATPQNLFFANVLPKGVAIEGWAKTGQYQYRSPTADIYSYDPQAGSFETHGGRKAAETDTPSIPPQPTTNVR